jgi:outer membrane protein W
MKRHDLNSWLGRAVAVLLLASPATSPAAQHDTDGPWCLRVDFALVNPTGDAVWVGPAGTAAVIELDTGVGAGLRAEYRAGERLGVELGVFGAGHLGVSSGVVDGWTGSGLEVGGFVPLTLGLNIHLTPRGKVDFYIGPQLALVRYSGFDAWAGSGYAITSEPVDNDVGWGVVAGLDVPVGTGGWMVQANLRYLEASLVNSTGIVTFDGKFNPLILSLGFGYRF